MDERAIFSFKKWFETYTSSFKSDDPFYKKNFQLKIDHSYRVCFEILDIGKSINLSREMLNLAELIALSHDLGRFEQLLKFGTFSDLNSIDHAILSIKVLSNQELMRTLPYEYKKIIYKSIYLHNKPYLPENLKISNEGLIFIKLLRDADKIDILNYFSNYYMEKGKNNDRNEAAELNLPDIDYISDDFFIKIMSEKPITYSNLKSLTEFKLLKLGWIYDINFKRALEIIKERGYIENIYSTIPKSEKSIQIYQKINSFLEQKLK